MSSDLVRPYREEDEAAVVHTWFESGRAEYSYLPDFQALTLELALQVFRAHILPDTQLWVGDGQGQITSFIALKKSYIDRLYVAPEHQSRGWGGRLMEHAKALHPMGLELHTHQENVRARSFYERRGFKAVRFGISPAPELVPDVEYHWRP